MNPRQRLATLAAAACGLLLASCNSTEINDYRVPRMPVYVPFTTQADWNFYAGGALDGTLPPLTARVFDRAQGIPANYPYPDYCFTGYGGVLLVGDLQSAPRCYDRSCPVERQPDVCVAIDRNTNLARCPQCGSTYDVFGVQSLPGGYPVSGPAAAEGYALRPFAVIYNVDGRYALLSN